MAHYILAPEAQLDLENIRQYTLQEWGSNQAKIYLVELALHFEKLALSPGLGRVRLDIGKDIRSFPVNAHVIYYREAEKGIEIARVLHERMDVTSQFE